VAAQYFHDLTLYAPSFFFLMVIFAQFPSNTNLLKQSEWVRLLMQLLRSCRPSAADVCAAHSRACDEQIRTLIIEDEFTDATNSAQKDFAKNALEVEGVDDIWCAGSRD
jgi:hypothetical protein